MQPYLFPYIGYFQLISAVDTFVIYDDVNYIKQGWINRNRILLNGNEYLFVLPLQHASSFKLINNIQIGDNKLKLYKTLEQSYKKAPFFSENMPVIKEILANSEINLARFVGSSLQVLSEFFGIKSTIVYSSELSKIHGSKGIDRVLDICCSLHASSYLNPIGGRELYSKAQFAARGFDLKFLKSKPIEYLQNRNEFVAWLSIIDVMMYNSKGQIQKMLLEYDLI